MRILVTGTSGLLGLNLALENVHQHTIIGVDRLPLKIETFQALQADLLEPGVVERLFEQTHPDWVIHCAALADLEACEANPALAQQLNVDLSGKLAALAVKDRLPLVYISTDAVFDGQRGNYTEEDTPKPLSIYARTKLAGEHAVAEANPGAIVARVNMFGWSPSGQRSLAELFVYNLQAGKPMKGFTDVYFCPLLVNDLAHILVEMLEKGLKGLYHVFSSECASKYDFGLRIAQHFKLDSSLISASTVADAGLQAVRSPLLIMDTSKLERALGRPQPRLTPAIERFYDLYQRGYPQKLRAYSGLSDFHDL